MTRITEDNDTNIETFNDGNDVNDRTDGATCDNDVDGIPGLTDQTSTAAAAVVSDDIIDGAHEHDNDNDTAELVVWLMTVELLE